MLSRFHDLRDVFSGFDRLKCLIFKPVPREVEIRNRKVWLLLLRDTFRNVISQTCNIRSTCYRTKQPHNQTVPNRGGKALIVWYNNDHNTQMVNHMAKSFVRKMLISIISWHKYIFDIRQSILMNSTYMFKKYLS
jgi:hypothetical protein